MLRLALPSNNEFLAETLRFLESCGLPVERASGRSYAATLPAVPSAVVLFQRATDITGKVEEGSADLGIVGLDGYTEARAEGGDTLLLVDNLGYSRCDLLLAVPDSWIDVTSIFDLADLAVAMRDEGRELRVATKYPRMVRRYLYSKGINYFTLVEAAGAMEAAPLMGYADLIADIVETGATIRENRLKTIADGTVLRSQAVLIGNSRTLHEDPERLEAARRVLELMEGRLRAGQFYRLSSNIQGESEEAVARAVTDFPAAAGIQGPTIAPVHSKVAPSQKWYAVTVVVERTHLLPAVDHLRKIGGSDVTATPVSYVFRGESQAFRRLLESTPEPARPREL